jgi:hypothetical protein
MRAEMGSPAALSLSPCLNISSSRELTYKGGREGGMGQVGEDKCTRT